MNTGSRRQPGAAAAPPGAMRAAGARTPPDTAADSLLSGPGGQISDAEFEQLARWLYEASGIRLTPAKKALVCGRLGKRLAACGTGSYRAYLTLIQDPRHAAERQHAIDLLTTNETYFFREPRHFEWLESHVLASPPTGRALRIWSAACSSGEEVYTLAMLLAEHFGTRGAWELIGSDLSTRVLASAQAGVYTLERARGIPPALLRRYCLRGVGAQAGKLMIERSLRERAQFRQVNLTEALPDLGLFDVIFLRNVMIYFDVPTKRHVVGQLVRALRPGGHLFIGHSENLHGLCDSLQSVAPSIYRRSS